MKRKALIFVCFGFFRFGKVGFRTAYGKLEVFAGIDRPNFQSIVIEKKEDLWSGFRAFMLRDAATREAISGNPKVKETGAQP